jgi:RNA polymerase sigma-70 factor (ECF subfamily)
MTNALDSDPEALWRQFSDDVHAFILRRVARPEDAEDLTQLVFLRIVEGIDSLRDAQRLTGWLYAMTRNAITDYYRSAPRRREVAVEMVPDQPLSDEPESAEHELAQCLLPLVERLPAEQAQAIRLVDLAGMSQTAAAARVRVSHSRMKSRVQRGRARLRELLLTCCHVERDVGGRVQGCASRDGAGDSTCHR